MERKAARDAERARLAGLAHEGVLQPQAGGAGLVRRAPRNRPYPGSDVLGGETAGEVLERVLDGDPLDMDGRCFARLRHNATLVDGDRLYDRATAAVAIAALDYDGAPELGRWLDRVIDRTIRALLDEDIEAERQGLPPTRPRDPAHGFLSDALGVEPPIARKCAVVFNGLPIPVRKAFWAMIMQDKSLNRAVAEGLGPPETCEARVRYAMGMMSSLGDWPEPNPDPGAPSWCDDEEEGT
ncbi:MAG: hypothetical protein H6828_14290 [Planctomycetes bacterium]|nr:hypothetical protein [Planctomycetota bacterium]